MAVFTCIALSPIMKCTHDRSRSTPGKCEQAKAIMLMIQNNLDPAVAQHPEELITYGSNGAVFQNWAQYATHHAVPGYDDRGANPAHVFWPSDGTVSFFASRTPRDRDQWHDDPQLL